MYRKVGNEGVAKAQEETIKAIEKATAEAKTQAEAEKKALESLATEKSSVKPDSKQTNAPSSTSEQPSTPARKYHTNGYYPRKVVAGQSTEENRILNLLDVVRHPKLTVVFQGIER